VASAIVFWIVGGSILAQPADFYEAQLREGQTDYAKGRYSDAAAKLRVASFGLLGQPELLSEALARLALAENAAQRPADADAVLARFVETERQLGSYRPDRLGNTLAAEFRALLTRRVPRDRLMAIPSLAAVVEGRPLPAAPLTPRPTAAPTRVATAEATIPEPPAVAPTPPPTVAPPPPLAPSPMPTEPPTFTARPTETPTRRAIPTRTPSDIPTEIPPTATAPPPTSTRTYTARPLPPTATRTARPLTSTRTPTETPTETPPERSANRFVRHKIPTAIAAVLLLVVAVLAVNSRRGDTATLASHSDEPTDKFPIQNGDWRIDSFRLSEPDINGNFEGSGRLTYTGNTEAGGKGHYYYVTVFKDGQQVAYLTGVRRDYLVDSVNFMRPGASADVMFISGDKYVPGPYRYKFKGPDPAEPVITG